MAYSPPLQRMLSFPPKEQFCRQCVFVSTCIHVYFRVTMDVYICFSIRWPLDVSVILYRSIREVVVGFHVIGLLLSVLRALT